MRIQILIIFTLLILSNAAFPAANHSIKNVLIVVAMEEEAAPIIKLLKLTPASAPDPNLPMKAYVGHYANLDVELILNGKDPMYGVQNIGTQPAVLATYLGISHYHPDLVLSVGTAGGLSVKDVEIGDIYISNKIYFYDRRLHSPDYKLYGAGGYHSMDTTSLIKKLNVKSGTVCSGDSFDEDQTDHEMFIKQGCIVKEMEAAGVSWVCMLTKTPMFALKGITDHIGHVSTHDEFEKNSATVTKKLALKTQAVLQYLSGS